MPPAPKRLTTLSRAHSRARTKRQQQREKEFGAVFRRSAAELLHVSIMTEANYRKHHALTEGFARPRGRAMKLTYFEVMAKGLG